MLALLLGVPFVATLVVVPWAILQLPADYFSRHRRRSLWSNRHPLVRWLLLVAKNLLGVLLVITGIMMLVLPGQGLITVLFGVMLLDFPGKFRFQRWLVCRGPILRAVNWLREKWHKPPFQIACADEE